MTDNASKLSPLHPWIAHKIGCPPETLTRQAIAAYQLQTLHETLHLARRKSNYYQRRLAGFPPDIVGLDELKQYPFTTGEDISREPLQFLCVSQNDQRYGSPGDGDFVTMADLDDVLFPVDGVCNFTASVSREGNTERLHVEVYGPAEIQVSAVQQALDAIPAVRVAWSVGHLDVVSMVRKEGLSELSGPPKRMIVDWRTRSD